MRDGEISFADLDFKSNPKRSTHHWARMAFPNGYGASVTIHDDEPGNYELAVLHNGGLCYTTPITDDVIGYLTPDMVTSLLRQIAALPTEETK